MKRIFSLFAVLGLGFVLSACELQTDNVLVVGLEAAYAPFNWSTPTQNDFTVELDGQPGVYVDGFDVVMASAIAEDMGYDLVIKAIDWDGLIPALLAGTIDVIIAGMSPTATRAQTIAFSDAYYQSEQVLVVRQGGAYENATTLAAFNGLRIGAQEGTLQADLITQITGATSVILNTYADLVTSLIAGTSDAFIAELPVAQGAVAANPDDLAIVQFTGSNGFTVSLEDITVSVGLRQEDTALLALINAALATIDTATRNGYMESALTRQPQ
jgi:ABC-type amino acid transport substrate-binding protein